MALLSRRLFVGCAASLLASSLRAHQAAPHGKVVVAGGHPGDPEYGCGGTIAEFTSLGHDVTLLYLNRGEKGCAGKSASECAATRTSEAQRACRILRAQPRFADQIDGEAIVDAAHYGQFRSILEAEKPDLILTQWPVDNHRDHRALSNLVYDAWLTTGKTSGLYYYEVSDGEDTMLFSPSDYVDITHTEARKRAACYAHASQSPDRYYALQSQVARFRGVESGYEQAEAFLRHPESRTGLLP